MDKIYQQHPLSENTTRVIELLPPSSIQPSNFICCKLRTISLENHEQPSYCAVSYVWGDPDTTTAVLIDGEKLYFRRNIWRFLIQMQRENYRGALWIDTVSINQEDLAERSQQVAIMGMIYSAALKVHVWLGPATGNDLVVEAMRELRAINWKSMCKTRPYETSVDLWDRSREHEPLDHLQSCTEDFFNSMLELERVDYWDRMWTIQEFVLAREIELRRGPEILDGETLVWYEWARHETYRSQPELYPDCKAEDLSKKAIVLLPGVAMRTVHHRARRLRCKDPDSWKEEIDDLIHKYQKSRCANCLDHVYALLPLSISGHLIVPDYRKSRWELFHDVGRIVSSRRNEPEYIQWRNPAQWWGRLKYDFKLFL